MTLRELEVTDSDFIGTRFLGPGTFELSLVRLSNFRDSRFDSGLVLRGVRFVQVGFPGAVMF